VRGKKRGRRWMRGGRGKEEDKVIFHQTFSCASSLSDPRLIVLVIIVRDDG
jgi:hypothetical protein